MRRVFVDSSAFLSLESPDERSHRKVRNAFEELVGAKAGFLTTNFVFDETYTLILTRLGRSDAVKWGRNVKAGKLVQVVRVDEDQEEKAWEIIQKFSDKDFSYTDATSFAVAESLKIEEALSVDHHFHQYGQLQVIPS